MSNSHLEGFGGHFDPLNRDWYRRHPRPPSPPPSTIFWICQCWWRNTRSSCDWPRIRAVHFHCSRGIISSSNTTHRSMKRRLKHWSLQSTLLTIIINYNNTSACQVYGNLGRKISSSSGDDREGAFLFQRVSVLVQRFNAVFVTWQLANPWGPDCTDW